MLIAEEKEQKVEIMSIPILMYNHIHQEVISENLFKTTVKQNLYAIEVSPNGVKNQGKLVIKAGSVIDVTLVLSVTKPYQSYLTKTQKNLDVILVKDSRVYYLMSETDVDDFDTQIYNFLDMPKLMVETIQTYRKEFLNKKIYEGKNKSIAEVF